MLVSRAASAFVAATLLGAFVPSASATHQGAAPAHGVVILGGDVHLVRAWGWICDGGFDLVLSVVDLAGGVVLSGNFRGAASVIPAGACAVEPGGPGWEPATVFTLESPEIGFSMVGASSLHFAGHWQASGTLLGAPATLVREDRVYQVPPFPLPARPASEENLI